jgi:hypothetical protein
VTTPATTVPPAMAAPPTRRELAVMIWLAVFPTLTVPWRDRTLQHDGPYYRYP